MSQALEKGTVLRGNDNRYTIIRALGQGSFGITYLAHTQVEGSLGTVDVEVAVKEFFMKDINSRDGSSVTGSSSKDGLFDKYRQKFRREAQNLAKMKHPGIVRVIEAFDTNNTSYIAMQYLGGGSLDDFIARRGKLPEDEALRYARGIGEALEYMHSHKMLHLDLKPSNVMLNRQGDPVIIDFGLSKQYDESGNPESSTTVGGGTPGYAPIEQASYREGKGFPVTIDIYALGATLFKMLCGHRPPEVSDLFEEGFPYGDLEGVSEGTVAIVAKAMSLHKGDRYQTVGEFLAALGGPKADESTSIVNEETDIEVAQVVSTPTPTPKPAVPRPSSLSERGAQRAEDEKAKPVKNKSRLWLFLLLAAVAAIVVLIVLLPNGSDGDIKDTTNKINVEPVKTIPVGNVLLEMIYVEGGTFTMGCTGEQGDECDGDEKPTHQVTLDGYFIGETEVTQALWREVMGSEPTEKGGWTTEYGRGDNFPAYRVSYEDVQEFIKCLNKRTGRTFRLPTEAEWEYAARGGSRSRGYKYSGSDTPGNVAWYYDNSGHKTHPVKGKQANELGLYDMSGNVWEWCQDWYGNYGSDSLRNPQGPSSGSDCVYRGGGGGNDARYCRVSNRSNDSPSIRASGLGFRLVLEP